MIVVDAAWEKRNLGVSCYEITIERTDSMEDVSSAYSTLEERQYMVVKVPSDYSEAARFFQNQGYRFAEVQMVMAHKKDAILIEPRLKKICQYVSWKHIKEEDLREIDDEIDKGIFESDRVTLDPLFTKEQACRRFRLWVRDGIASGYMPYRVFYKEVPVGFISKGLAAIYKEFSGTGFGYCVQYAGVCIAKENYGNRAKAVISGNNPAVLRIQQSFGYEIEKMRYVFVKHLQ